MSDTKTNEPAVIVVELTDIATRAITSAPLFLRLISARSGLKMLAQTGGRLMITSRSKGGGSANLRKIATEYTGKKYPAGNSGLTAAAADLDTLAAAILAIRSNPAELAHFTG